MRVRLRKRFQVSNKKACSAGSGNAHPALHNRREMRASVHDSRRCFDILSPQLRNTGCASVASLEQAYCEERVCK